MCIRDSDIITGGDAADTIVGNAGADSITGGAGDDIITGGDGTDTFNVDSGTDTVNDLGGSSGGENDIVIISAGATVNANNIVSFVATSATQNNSTDAGNAVLTAKSGAGRTISVANATGSSKAFTLVGSDGNDLLTGGAGDDIISVTSALSLIHI